MRYGRTDGARITIGGKSLLNLCSNDYLGMCPTQVPQGQLQSSSRLLAGNDESYRELEDALAGHKSQESSLVYPTGYMANMGAISAVASAGDLILSDELNHASIIDACKITGAAVSIYKHNDMDDLSSKIRGKAQNKFIVCEGIFSMDGDYSDLARISEVARKEGAVTILDDAHGDFAVGSDGRGTPDELGSGVDVYISSLSKGLGSFGGYVASQNNVIDLCVNRSRQFIYTSALPRQLVSHAAERLLSERSGRQNALRDNVAMLSRGLGQLGCQSGDTHIMPIHVGGEKKAVEYGRFLFERGVFAQPVRYPTVPRGQARIRVSVTAWLSREDIDFALGAFEAAQARFSA
ncbi:MAG: aminotransferase class I/II-fold pyridoxal phosphate-dependent enzyme [Nitrosopumilus sp. H8]|nr:MAG: aminotransferase class I/II-fold pyridoxal phosphate-dependent enzyme [Nitrosopumilus sp. H8]